jgi:hypothetical protein
VRERDKSMKRKENIIMGLKAEDTKEIIPL